MLVGFTLPALAQNPSPDANAAQEPFVLAPGAPDDLDGLRDLLVEAAKNNPELRARFNAYRARLEEAPQAASLPDPEVTFSFYTNPDEDVSTLGRFQGAVSQRIPWFGTLGAREERELHFAEAELRRFERSKLDLFRDVQQAWFRYVGIQRTIEMTQRNLDLLASLRPLVRSRYETARAGQVDVIRLRMEQDKLETRLHHLRDARRPVQADLNALLNRAPETPVDVPDALPEAPLPIGEPSKPALQRAATDGMLPPSRVLNAPVDTLRDAFVRRAADADPTLRALEAEAGAYRADRQVARKEGRPSFGLGVRATGRDHGMNEMMDLGNLVFAEATISVPLYREQYRARQRQAAFQEESARLQRERRLNRLESEVETLLKQYRDASQNAILYREQLLPQATQAVELLKTDYAGGRVRFDEVIQMQRERLDYAIQLIDARVAQHQIRAELEALLGVGLGIQPDYRD